MSRITDLSPRSRRRAGRQRRSAAARGAAVLVVLAGACSPSRPAPVPLPAAPGVVDVTMGDYRYDYDPKIARGTVVFRFRNIGTKDHAVTFVDVPEGYPPIAEQLAGTERRGAHTRARVNAHAPGTTATFAVDLRPGRYAMVCFLADPDGVQHFAKGMSTEFRVR